ncbi:hypothetical protein HBH98_167040 [Parastagonospora nodorum]|nr:hypothetical protein HBH98_167040 [Parastagonospora nodorum]KAH4367205.1 hypothetical protein HBH97_162790 [Parastagonospora nodorum]KAH4389368.1 hypothetical protein HBH99_159010 [Parastagonospora nodorum]KAH4905884.1 hypothetical protein HBI80_088060 [Parastagonospora nodorum]KAH5066363.1 hypothetical protein HBH95_204960 [Parastagonospora nodorum]
MDSSSSGGSPSPVLPARKTPGKAMSQTVHLSPPPSPTEDSSATLLPQNIMAVTHEAMGPSQQIVKNNGKVKLVKLAKPHVTSKLIGNITISFRGPEERFRAKKDLLPSFAYRTSGEKSGTLSRYQPEEVHAKSRRTEELVLLNGNAFQNHATFNASRDMTPQRIERQYVTQQRKPPSSFVSACHTKATREHGANRHARPDTSDNAWRSTTLVILTRPVKIPIWIRDTARPMDGSAITIQQYHDSGADMWVNGREMRKTGDFDMNCGASNSHDDEWLCCGAIPESIITNVMPFDGNKVHRKKGYEFVKSIKSMEIYIWNFDEWIWEHNPDTTDYRPYRLAKLGDKRLAPDDDEGDDEGDDECDDESDEESDDESDDEGNDDEEQSDEQE